MIKEKLEFTQVHTHTYTKFTVSYYRTRKKERNWNEKWFVVAKKEQIIGEVWSSSCTE